MQRLDTDVIEIVSGSLDDIHDLLSLSLASSVIWPIAIRQVLRKHTINLTTRKAIHAFRGFIINRKSTCAHHLRSLNIPDATWMNHEPTRPDEDIQQVLEILGCAVNLDSLYLSLDNVYSVIPPVSLPFSTFESLRCLTLCEPLTNRERSWIHHALRALRAPLVTLCIETGNYESHSSPSVLASLFDRNLSHFSTSSTLTSLHLARVPMYDDTFLGLPRFPSVRSLTIAKRLPREPKMDALLHLFPSLSGTLRLRMEYWKSLEVSSNPAELGEIKAANTRAQAASRWTKLDRLDCESSTAHMLALQCPVRHLTIDAFDLFAVAAVQPRNVVVDSVRLPFYYDISQSLAATPVPIATTHVVLIMSCEAEEYENAKINFYQPDSVRWETVLVSPEFPSSNSRPRVICAC